MVDIVGSAGAAPLEITVRPNCALRAGECFVVLALLLPVSLLIAAGFTFFGAWLVVPFVALALAALLWAMRELARHAGDFERITLAGDRVLVDRHRPDADEHFEFNGYWVQVICRPAAAGGCDYLALRSHGRELVLGLDLTDRERASVGKALLTRIARMRR